MTYYAVIDTNVFISALLSKIDNVATVKVLRVILDGRIVPLYKGFYRYTGGDGKDT